MSRLIKKVRVAGLLGRFDYEISVESPENFIIIIAPNGHGKTVLLNLIHWALNAEVERLAATNFRRLEIEFDDHSELLIKRTAPRKRNSGAKIEYAFSYPKGYTLTFNSHDPGETKPYFSESTIERLFPFVQRIDHNMWLDRTTGEALTTEELYMYHGGRIPSRYRRPEPEMNQRLKDALNQTDCTYIAVQRTIEVLEAKSSRHGRLDEKVIEQQHGINRRADDLKNIIDRITNQLALQSQALDRSFPQRVLTRIAEKKRSWSQETIREKLAALENERKELSSFNLLKDSEHQIKLPQINFDDQLRNVLQTYLSDAQQKMAIIRPIKKKIELFIDILNEKYEFKSVHTGERSAIIVKSQEGDQIDLLSLSSGEQHEFILLYDLIFGSKPGSLFLIDEPEISLHVAWQKRFLRDLARIRALTEFQAIIATHSPQIIGPYRASVVDLAKQVK